MTDDKLPEFPGPAPYEKCNDPNIVGKHAVAAIWRLLRGDEPLDVEKCNEALAVLVEYRERTLRHVGQLIARVGRRGKCKSCGAEAWWMYHTNGKSAPYSIEGVSHFADCREAETNRRQDQ